MKFPRPSRKDDEPRPTGYVGDYADKLSRVRPLAHDDDERPCREDLLYGRTLFTLPPRGAPVRRRRRRTR